MKKIKWGVIGTAGIARSCTIPGMIQAYNCELYAIAGRSIDKAEQFKENSDLKKPMEVIKNCWMTRKWKRYILRCQILYIMSGP